MRFELVHRKLKKCLYVYLGETKDRGFGVFAAKPFKKGEVILIDEDGDYYDQVVSYAELLRLGCGLDKTIQVGPDAFKLPTGSLDDFTNHSCDPNTGVRLTERGTVVVALRDIGAHEELTYDYSTYLSNPYERMVCRCGAPNCRGIIGSFAALPAELRERYIALDVVGKFAREAPPACRDAAD